MNAPKNLVSYICNTSTLTLFLLFFLLSQIILSQQLAFPTAYGAGAYTTGGRGNVVIHVTNLNDSGRGSLREALLMTVKRTIVFDVSGVITLKTLLAMDKTNSNVTIAGQTAPEGGITIDGHRLYMEDVDNVICRYIRFRGGVTAKGLGWDNNDSLTATGDITNQIFDHCSFSWDGDETASWYGNKKIDKVTVQRSIFGEGLKGSLFGGTINAEVGGMSMHHSLFYNTTHRTPNVSGHKGAKIETINNVVWTISHRLIQSNGDLYWNHINNYYDFGNAAINGAKLHMHHAIDNNPPQIYSEGNKIIAVKSNNLNNFKYTVKEINLDNKKSHRYFQNGSGHKIGDELNANYFTSTQHPLLGNPISIQSADDAFYSVKNDVGCNERLNADGSVSDNKDVLDADWLNNVQKGIYVDRSNSSKWIVPKINSIKRSNDFYKSNPHIPEEYFKSYVPKGQNHNDIAPSGYTWLEEYLNGVDRSNDAIKVGNIEMSPSSAELQISNTLQLAIKFTPEIATNKTGKWTSSDEDIATVDAIGLVTAVSTGSVEITFTSADGGLKSSSEVTVVLATLQTSAGKAQTICAGTTATLTATGGSTYLWNTGATTASISVSPSSTRIYTVTAYDNTGKNSATDEVKVTVNPSLTVNAGSNVSINSGDSTTLTATGASTYKWSTGATSASITVNPTSTTTYTVTGTRNGCEATSTVRVTVLQPVRVNADAGNDQTICSGTSATLTAKGGSTYLWSNGSKAASITVSPNQTTSYTVTAYDNSGKNSDTAEVKVTVNPFPKVNAGSNITITSGESTALTATGASTYRWNTGATSANITVSPTSTTTYTVTGIRNGCEATSTVRVTVLQPVRVNADAGIDQTICSGTSATLTATGGSTYLWSNGSKTTSISVSPNQTTKYTVTAYDSTGKNSATAEVKVTVIPLPTVSAGNNITITSGESTTLIATGASTYRWNTGATSANITVSPTSTTTYTVTGNRNGCEATSTVRVTVEQPVRVNADAGSNQTICSGTSATLTAKGGSTYLWSNGSKTASITVSPNQTTTYTVTAYDSTGKNSDTAEVKVTVNPLPTVSGGRNISITSGEGTTLTATGASTYKWSTGATGASITVSPTATTTYTVTGTRNGCEATSTVRVNVAQPVRVTADAGSDQSICSGTMATLTAKGGSTYLWSNGAKTASITVSPIQTTTYTVTAYDSKGKNSDTAEVKVKVNPLPTVSGGRNIPITSGESTTLTATGAATYKWSTGATGASITVSPSATTTYTVTGTRNGCEATSTVRVNVAQPVRVTADAGSDQSICSGTSATLTAKGGSTYFWSNGAKTASITVNPNQTTTYTVTAYDSTGKNSDTAEVKVMVNPLPTVSGGRNISITSGESTTLTATGASSYKWSTGATGASIIVSPTATTTYTVTGIRNGCEATSTVRVTVALPVRVAADAGIDQNICSGTSATLTAKGGSTYLWSNGAKTSTITVSPIQTTTYTVTAYDGTGKNSDTAEVKVTVNPLPTVSAGSNITINSGESTTLTATGASSYKWSSGATGDSTTVSPTATTTYTVTGTRNGCEATSTVKVTVLKQPKVVAHAGGNQDICQGSSVTLTASGGDTYLWSNGQKTESITVSPKTTTTYSVTAYVGKASNRAEAMVNVRSNPNVKITNGSEAVILDGEFLTLSAIGAKTYKWNNGATQPNIAVRPNATTTYTVTGHDNKCAAEKSIDVKVFEKVIAGAGKDVTIYRNESTALTATGPNNSEFLWSTGETTKSIVVSPEEDTEYSVMVYHALDSDTANVKVRVLALNDSVVLDDTVDLEFSIYPNPTDSELNIKISGLTNLSSIHLYDLSGKSLFSEIINESDQQNYIKSLNLSNYASGIYLLQLVDNQRVITKKVMVK